MMRTLKRFFSKLFPTISKNLSPLGSPDTVSGAHHSSSCTKPWAFKHMRVSFQVSDSHVKNIIIPNVPISMATTWDDKSIIRVHTPISATNYDHSLLQPKAIGLLMTDEPHIDCAFEVLSLGYCHVRVLCQNPAIKSYDPLTFEIDETDLDVHIGVPQI